MKRTFLALCAVLLTVSVMARDLPYQGFGIQVGFAQPILRLDPDPTPWVGTAPYQYYSLGLDNKTKANGVKVGVVYDVTYVKGFGSSIGLNYTYAAAKSGWEQVGTVAEYPIARKHTKYHALELYVDWQYKFEVAKETYIILYTGPSIQYAVSLKSYVTTKGLADQPETLLPNSEYSHYGNNDRPDENMKALNVTWGVGAGFQYQRFFLRGGYDFGLINPYRNRTFEGSSLSTGGRLDQWQIKLGVYLWYDND